MCNEDMKLRWRYVSGKTIIENIVVQNENVYRHRWIRTYTFTYLLHGSVKDNRNKHAYISILVCMGTA